MAFGALGCDPSGELLGQIDRTRRDGIVNGTPTGYENWQSAVMIQVGDVRCTGTLIHPELVLTAGHCVYLDTAEASYDFRSHPEVVFIYGGSEGEDLLAYVDDIITHSSWEGDIDENAGDLAFLLLDRSVRDITPARVVDFPGPEVGDSAVIVGYGIDPTDTSTIRPLHREGVTTILEELTYYYQIGGESNTCSGDSGGPMYVVEDGEWVLAGVTSFGAATCAAESEGYSVRLLSFCGWLNDTMTDLVGEDLGLEDCKGCSAAQVAEWGAPCGPGYPCCPEGTACRTPEGFSNSGLGFCAPSCCDIGTVDSAYCTNVAGGEEGCLFSDELASPYCVISCNDDGDCPSGTQCKNKPFASEKICIATEVGDGSDCDVAPDTDTEEDDTTTESDSEKTSNSSNGGCHQAAVGVRTPSYLRLLSALSQ